MNKQEKSKKIKDIREKIFKGLDLAFKRLVEKTAKENGKLVFSENGKIIYIDAKDIKLSNNTNVL
ncbi:MAG: hypothetical protein A2046_13420 [Bacteroidetes bacterium GWA2_30_7]|nr:MAG: hypothetical protein A2046_13420 [Bacteroidetes bacterium GWA2_30_7]